MNAHIHINDLLLMSINILSIEREKQACDNKR